ncbi:MAG: hypothetical protein QOK39_2871, partial [Acidimicrobiaceae bacterium]|nr:hypothetical protein [Acidimicrobiaceae bacterium]
MSVGTGPVWMLRINPTERRRLAEPELAGLLHHLLELDQAAPALAAEASDDLYRLVPQLADEGLRGRLLALRRSIHNDRHVPEALDLPVELPPSVARWAEHHDRRWACQIEIRRRYDDALATERSALRERLGEGNFLTTLAQSAPGVFEDACRYQRREAVDSKDRKAERALVQYLTRAMVRTSPYGRFTAVGLAQPGAGGVGMDEAGPDTATAHVEVDRALFEYVMGGLCPQAADPELSLPPTARVADGKITFFQVGPTERRRLSAPVTGATKVLVDLLGLGPRRLCRLADAVAERLVIDVAAAEQLLHRALNLGLLVTAWRGDQFVAEPVGQAQHDLEPSGAGGLLEGLRLFRGNLDRLGDTGDPDARAIHARRQQLIAQGEDLSRRAGRPARLTVNEDYVLDPLLVEPGIHRPALDDLATVTEFLGAFDRMHVVRALVAGAVVERFGPGCRVPLVEHAESLVQMVYRAEATFAARPDAPLGPPDGSLAMLAKIRHEAL